MKPETKIPFILAWKFLTRGNKWTLGLIIFFLAIAFINMIFIASLFNGITEGFNKQIIQTSTGNILVTPQDGQEVIKDTNEVLSQILRTDGVIAASSQTIVPGSLQYKNTKGSWQILAIDPNNEKKVTNVSSKMARGSYLDPNDTNQIILGSNIANPNADQKTPKDPFSFHGAKVGDTITLSFGNTKYDFTIKGIFHTKFIDTDSRAFITKKAYQKINPLYKNESTDIIIKIEKTGQEKEIIKRIKKSGVKENLYSWEQASSLMSSISDSFLSINVIMSTVAALIAAITVFIVIYIDISGKRQQIGILRAIGIKPYIIRATYVILTSIYSVAGVLLGSILFFGIIIPYFKIHPFVLPIADAVLSINYTDFIIRLESIILVAIFSGLIPAIMITRIKILDAIWGK